MQSKSIILGIYIGYKIKIRDIIIKFNLSKKFPQEKLKNWFLFKILWNVQAEDGKRKGRCGGNGRESALKRKNARESFEEREAYKPKRCFFRILKKSTIIFISWFFLKNYTSRQR